MRLTDWRPGPSRQLSSPANLRTLYIIQTSLRVRSDLNVMQRRQFDRSRNKIVNNIEYNDRDDYDHNTKQRCRDNSDAKLACAIS